MSDSNGKLMAPYLTTKEMLAPGGFATHYQRWLQYEVAKGDSAPSFQQTFEAGLLRMLQKRHGVVFSESAEMKDAETSEQFSTRRIADATQAADKIFEVVAPRGINDAATFIMEKCAFKVQEDTSLLLQVGIHEAEFSQALAQLGKDVSEHEKIKYYLDCFGQEMKKELKNAGSENKKLKRKTFEEWGQFADHVHTLAANIEKAESLRKLFYGSKSQRDGKSKIASEKPEKDRSTSRFDRSQIQCHKCKKFGHFQDQCTEQEPVRGRPEARQPQRPRGDSIDVALRRSARIGAKKSGDGKWMAAMAAEFNQMSEKDREDAVQSFKQAFKETHPEEWSESSACDSEYTDDESDYSDQKSNRSSKGKASRRR
jgi:hypothetical protein